MPAPANQDTLQATYDEFLIRQSSNHSVEIATLLLIQSTATQLIFDNAVRKQLRIHGRDDHPEEFVGEVFEIWAYKNELAALPTSVAQWFQELCL